MGEVKKAVITVAGRGTRLYPATRAVKKPMFPLVDTDGFAKPVVQIVVEEALAAGVNEICIVVSPGDEEVYKHHFSGLVSEELEVYADKPDMVAMAARLSEMSSKLSYVIQPEPEGYGHAVYQARDFVGDDSFLLMLGDHVYTTGSGIRCASQLCTRFSACNASAMTAVQVTPASELHLFGTLKGKSAGDGIYEVERIVEKPDAGYAARHLVTPGLPENMYLCHFGMHVFPREIFEALERLIEHDTREGGEIQLTSAQEDMRAQLPGGTYACCTINGCRHDTGNPHGLIETQLALSKSAKT
jgi:UTP--glucose-1-phosphate uridylyltransferase